MSHVTGLFPKTEPIGGSDTKGFSQSRVTMFNLIGWEMHRVRSRHRGDVCGTWTDTPLGGPSTECFLHRWSGCPRTTRPGLQDYVQWALQSLCPNVERRETAQENWWQSSFLCVGDFVLASGGTLNTHPLSQWIQRPFGTFQHQRTEGMLLRA